MKKVPLIAYCALFLGVCAFFSLGMLIPGAANAAEGDVTMPKLLTDSPYISINSDFGDEFEEYFQKSFAYRNNVVSAFSSLKTSLFSEGNEQVIVGNDGFLFFNDTLYDYMGTDPMSDEEIEAAADALLMIYERASEDGARFIFAPAPNKNTVYPEMMPSRYIANKEASNLDRLFSKLDENGVPYVDLSPILSDAKNDTLVYHKRDTHWNNEGARIAFEAIAEKIGFDCPDYSQFGGHAVHDHVGDLDTLLFPAREMYDDNTSYNFSEMYVFTTAYSTPMDVRIATRGGGKENLLMFRDSFANAIIPFAASGFSEVRFERGSPYCDNLQVLDSFDADYVIVMIAERNLRNLISQSQTDSK